MIIRKLGVKYTEQSRQSFENTETLVCVTHNSRHVKIGWNKNECFGDVLCFVVDCAV